MNEQDSPDTPTPQRALALNRACERFERAWRSCEPPRIEDYLEEAGAQERDAFLLDLLNLEHSLRRSDGHTSSERSYFERFPDQAAVVAAAFANANTVAPPDDMIRLSHPSLTIDLLTKRSQPSTPSVGSVGGSSFGDYELLEEIARGGMGVVYRARHTRLNRVVALKMILTGRFATEDEVRRFLLEVEATASFDHPNIVPVYEVGEREGLLFFSMKLVEGESLSHHNLKLSSDYRAVARLMATVARAIHYAHTRGYLHRDLKPANILVEVTGRPYVTDFGLSRKLRSDPNLTMAGQIVGTPSYMSPEQASGNVGAWTEVIDVYSLGAVLYELLTGRPPFRAATVTETLIHVLEREPAPPSQVRPGMPPDLESICLRCLGKSPSDRYPTAEDLADDLDCFARGEHVIARRAGPWMKLRRWCRREPELAARLGGFALLGTLIQINYINTNDSKSFKHIIITALTIMWGIASYLFQVALRKERGTDTIRLAWLSTEVILLTSILRVRDDPLSTGVVVYPLLISAAGLWSRVRLVWWTTILAATAYGALILDSYSRGKITGLIHNTNLVLGAIAITGFVVSQQVKRIWAISTYYDNRAMVIGDD